METISPIEKCLRIAKDLGVPRDQAKNFLETGYVPYPWQWKFHAAAREADESGGPVHLGVGGSRGPGKTHAIFSQITLDDLIRVSNLKALFLRKTGKAAKESLDDLVIKVLGKNTNYIYASSTVRFPNGSRVILGGFKDDRDIDNYIGQEYDIIAVEEANQLSERKITLLLGSLRTTRTDWRPRAYFSFNPGGQAHGYVKTKFVQPHRNGIETTTRFIPSTYRDNPNLNKEYIDYLESLEGQLGKAWREGDFDIMAGQYFTEWNYKIHVIPYFTPENHWRKICFLDYGYNAPSALYWAAISEEGQLFVYRELYRSGLTYSQLAEEFVASTNANEKIDYLVCDPSIWNKDGKSEGGLSGAEIFINRCRDLDFTIRLERGNNDRIAGWTVVREHLRPYRTKDPYTNKEITTAKLQIMDNCPDLIRVMPLQIHDEKNPEDLDTEMEDHAPDSLRYGIMSRPQPSMTAKQKEDLIFVDMIRKKKQHRGKERNLLFNKRF